MNLKNEKEHKYHSLFINTIIAETDKDIKLAEKKFNKFKKENPELVDEIQSRRWTTYGS